MVLVVEDDKSIQVLLCQIVKDLGMESCFASGAKDAIDALNKYKPSVALVDMILLDGDATPFIRYCQQNYPATKLVLITAMKLADIERIVKEFKLSYFLKKPFDLEKLESLINSLN